MAAEKNSTLVLPFPVELLRFLERSTPVESTTATPPAVEPSVPAVEPTVPASAPAVQPNGVPLQRSDA